MYQRRCARYSVHFQSTLSAAHIPEGNGTAIDLSIRGCRVQSFFPAIPGLRMKLSIAVSDPDTVIEVDQAVVRWVIGQDFGLEFVMISPDQFERLTKTLQQIPTLPGRG